MVRRKPPTTWKKVEARIADHINPGVGKRVPLSGSNSGHDTCGDGRNLNGIYVETKHRKKHQITTLHDDTRKKAKKENRVPVTAIHETGRHGFLYVVHSEDIDKFIKIMMRNRKLVFQDGGNCQENWINDPTRLRGL